MVESGTDIIVKHGLFYGYEGKIIGHFKYNGKDVFVVNMLRDKKKDEIFTTTVSYGEFEVIYNN